METKRLSNKIFIVFAGILLFLCGIICVFCGNDTKLTDASTESTAPYYCLRDEYYINTENQYAYGLCWEFATLKSIETCLAINTGEYYDFSEAYIALIQKAKNPSSSYLVGGNGGTMGYAMNYIKEYGLLLESDFNFDELNYANNDNYDEYLKLLSKSADKNIAANLTSKSLTGSSRATIKNHILKNGSLYMGITNYDYKLNPVDNTTYLAKSSSSSMIGHAISIIGWDDNYTATIDNTTYKGAYIMLNSYGNDWRNDGVFYCLYDYQFNDLVNTISGVVYTAPSVSVNLRSINNFSINNKNAYNQQVNYEKSAAVTKNNNIFEYKGTESAVNLRYEIKNYLKYTDVDVKIYKSGSLSNDFNISHINGAYMISKKPEADILGSYKILFKIDGQNVAKTFVVVSNLEFSYAFTRYAFSVNSYTYLYTNFNTVNNQNVINIYSNYGKTAELVKSAYSQIADIQTDSDDVLIQEYDKRYSVKYLGTQSEFSTKLTLTNFAGFSVVYTINFYLGNGILANIQYNLDDAENLNPEYIYFDSTTKYYINSPNLDEKILTRVYYIDEYGAEQNCAFDMNTGKFYITNGDLNYSPSYNSLTASTEITTLHFSLILNFEFSDDVSINLEVMGESGANTTRFDYGENLTFKVTLTGGTVLSSIWAIDGVAISNINDVKFDAGQYQLSCIVTYKYGGTTFRTTQSKTITILPIALNVLLDNTVFTYNGTDQVPTVTLSGFVNNENIAYTVNYPAKSVNAGQYNLTISLNNSNYIVNDSISYRIAPAAIVLRIDDKTGKIGETPQELTYSVIGNVYEKLNIKLSVNLGDTAGDYEITANCDNNPNYSIFVQKNGVYTLQEGNSINTNTDKNDTNAAAQTAIIFAIGVGAVVVIVAVVLLVVARGKRRK